jgi:hypothetical protein
MQKLSAAWITGYFDGRSCFRVIIDQNPQNGQLILTPALVVSRAIYEDNVLKAFQHYFKCGELHEEEPSLGYTEWRVDKLEDLMAHVLPFLAKHKLKTGLELLYLGYFCDLCAKLHKKEQLTPEGYEACIQLALRLNIRGPKGLLMFELGQHRNGKPKLIDVTDEKTMAWTRGALPHFPGPTDKEEQLEDPHMTFMVAKPTQVPVDSTDQSKSLKSLVP